MNHTVRIRLSKEYEPFVSDLQSFERPDVMKPIDKVLLELK
jgi:hypothetical protein